MNKSDSRKRRSLEYDVRQKQKWVEDDIRRGILPKKGKVRDFWMRLYASETDTMIQNSCCTDWNSVCVRLLLLLGWEITAASGE